MSLRVREYELPKGTLPSQDVTPLSDKHSFSPELCEHFLLSMVDKLQQGEDVRFVLVEKAGSLTIWVCSPVDRFETIMMVDKEPAKRGHHFVTLITNYEGEVKFSTNQVWNKVVAEAERTCNPAMAARLRDMIDVRP